MTCFIGREGEYQIFNSRFICQSKYNLEGESLRRRVVHLTVETIEDIIDRNSIRKKLNEIEWREIEESVVD